MKTPHYRHASTTDLNRIATLQVESARVAYKGYIPQKYLDNLRVQEIKALWHNVLEENSSHMLLAEQDGHIVGFIVFEAASADKIKHPVEIYTIYVDPNHLGAGVGSGLIQQALNELSASDCSDLFLWTLDGNKAAIDFYCKRGFKMTSTKRPCPDYPGAMLTEVQLTKKLSP